MEHRDAPRRPGPWVTVLYVNAVFLSAALLFLVQPIIAKMVLPALGGSPSVWNTCMVFFQAALLAGYVYAHLLTRWLRAGAQVAVHVLVVGAGLVCLPLGLAASPVGSVDGSPSVWLLGTLAASVGATFCALAATGPLLQRWFSTTLHREAGDPYFLFAVSNLGSFAALLAYPFALERILPLSGRAAGHGPLSQSLLWSAGYVLLGGLVIASGFAMLRWRAASEAVRGANPPAPQRDGIPWARRVRWVLLALVPSSALLGTTQFVTTEVGSAPLLWTVPLTVYLLTFVLAFSRRVRIPARASGAGLAVLVVGVAGAWLLDVRPPALAAIALHFLALLAVGLACHGRLASDRPAPERLTEYYLWIAVGGTLGGSFNALAAPVLFDSVVEYPLALMAACLLAPLATHRARTASGPRRWATDAATVAVVAAAAFGLDALARSASPGALPTAARVGVPCVLALAAMRRPVRFALALGVLFIAGSVRTNLLEPPLLRARTFFGVHRVVRIEPRFVAVEPTGASRRFGIPFHVLVHGTTRHGSQAVEPDRRRTPTSYYHRSGPIGQVFESLERSGRADRVGVVGLGAGTLAAYGRPRMHLTFYDIDDEVVRIARDSGLFTYLADSLARVDFVVGDGRTSLGREPDGTFGLLVLDAFSSDAIPVHLVTREAVNLYLGKLRPDGVLAFHLSSATVDLVPVLVAIAADLRVAMLLRSDPVAGVPEQMEGKDSSQWALLARSATALEPIAADPRWKRLPTSSMPPRPGLLWTDDFSNLLSVLRAR